LQVKDVARSIDWYVKPAVRRVTPVLRGPERMFYGLVEYEVEDPDGHRVCVSGSLPVSANVPLARE
jgi:hypothetical protein